MEIEFCRTGERRYALRVHRDDRPPLEIGGPRYDPFMPRALQQFIVESELGLGRGIFGFLAAGGDGGSTVAAAGEDRRAQARRRARAKRRGGKLLRRGARDDGPASERATYLCWYEWLR